MSSRWWQEGPPLAGGWPPSSQSTGSGHGSLLYRYWTLRFLGGRGGMSLCATPLILFQVSRYNWFLQQEVKPCNESNKAVNSRMNSLMTWPPEQKLCCVNMVVTQLASTNANLSIPLSGRWGTWTQAAIKAAHIPFKNILIQSMHIYERQHICKLVGGGGCLLLSPHVPANSALPCCGLWACDVDSPACKTWYACKVSQWQRSHFASP